MSVVHYDLQYRPDGHQVSWSFWIVTAAHPSFGWMTLFIPNLQMIIGVRYHV